MVSELQHYYDLLGAAPGATPQQLKAAYRQQIKRWHPDQYLGDAERHAKCVERMKHITEAYKRLESLRSLAHAVSAAAAVKLSPVRQDEFFGYADDKGFLRIPAIYEAAGEFREGLAAVCRDHVYGYINTAGATVIPLRYSYAGSFYNGVALVQSGRFGFIDRYGEWIIPARFEAATEFREGFAAVKAGGQWGYVRENGEWLTFPQFAEALEFQNGRGVAMRGSQRVYVFPTGEIRPA